jgi:hypothetical protein
LGVLNESPNGKGLLKDKVAVEIKMPLLMDRACESDEIRELARDWDYNRQLHK